jgi:hypothetical protein
MAASQAVGGESDVIDILTGLVREMERCLEHLF